MSADGRLLDVEDLAADRQQRLVLGVAGQLGGAERGVALDDEQLAALDVVACGSRRAWPAASEVSSAFLRRWVSLCCAGGDPGLRRGDDLLQEQRGLRLVVALGGGRGARVELVPRPPWRRCRAPPAVPSTSLVWPSNCGSASRTVTTAVSPSRTSSLSSLSSSPAFSRRALRSTCVAERLEQRLLEPGQVGAALGRGDDVDERRGPRCRSRCPSAARRRRRSRARPRSGSCGPRRRAPARSP